jgi:hypothetical protein
VSGRHAFWVIVQRERRHVHRRRHTCDPIAGSDGRGAG